MTEELIDRILDGIVEQAGKLDLHPDQPPAVVYRASDYPAEVADWLRQRGLTIYRLSQETVRIGRPVPHARISSWLRRERDLQMLTWDKICEAMDSIDSASASP